MDRNTINKHVKDYFKDFKFENKQMENNYKGQFKTKEDYNKSFEDIVLWRKKYKGILDFENVYYHGYKTDGLFAAAIYYIYMKNELKKETSKFIKMKAGRNMDIDRGQIRDKSLLVLDLSFSTQKNKELEELTGGKLLVLDDHNDLSTEETEHVFISGKHSACAITWKFFYPDKDVPEIIQIIDSDDRKLNLPWFGKATNWVATALGFMFAHNESAQMRHKKNTGEIIKIIADVIEENNSFYWAIMGRYMDEAIENLKEQIASTAQEGTFMGHKVGILNFMSQLLPKRVARQILTNFEYQHRDIDFVVLYSYQKGFNAYQVQLFEKHEGTPKYNLPKMAEQLGELGGDRRKGGGSKYIGNFYWPKKENQDIWNLFEAKNITELKKLIKH